MVLLDSRCLPRAPPADLHGTTPGRLLRFDLDAVTTSRKAPSYMEESYVKGIIEEKQARVLCRPRGFVQAAARGGFHSLCPQRGWLWVACQSGGLFMPCSGPGLTGFFMPASAGRENSMEGPGAFALRYPTSTLGQEPAQAPSGAVLGLQAACAACLRGTAPA